MNWRSSRNTSWASTRRSKCLRRPSRGPPVPGFAGGGSPELAPRLCAAFGTIRSAYPDPASLQNTRAWRRSGKKRPLTLDEPGAGGHRSFCAKPLSSGAYQTVRHSAWAKVYYERSLKQGKKHPAILRALAFK